MIKKGREIDQSIVPLTPTLLEQLEKNKPSGGFKLPQGYLSPSQIDMYLRCPRQYYFRYVRDMTKPPGIALVLGSSAHKAVETTHHYIVDHNEPAPVDVVLSSFSDAFDKNAEEIPKEELNEENLGSVKDAGVSLVRLYNKNFAPKVRPRVKDGVRGIEQKIKISVGGVPMLGYIDLIDSNADVVYSYNELDMLQKEGGCVAETLRTSIVDFKTKTKALSQTETDNSLQLTFYAYATGINQVRHDQLLRQKIPKIKRACAVRTSSDYKWLHEIVSSVAKAVSAGIFPPCAPDSWMCTPKWCGFYATCRAQVFK
ncbi:MAG: PD-(D/E)XK nuclease family protein [Desulfobacteraceae bacterium]|jgi:putative RecB family exonuclease